MIESSALTLLLPKVVGGATMTPERLLRPPPSLVVAGGVLILAAAVAVAVGTRLVDADRVLNAGDPTFILAVSRVM